MRWHRPNAIRTVCDFGATCLQLILPFIGVAIWPHPAAYVAAFFLIGGAQQGLDHIIHEFAHTLVIPGNPKLNDWIGRWCFAAVGAMPFDLYRHRHFDHHRYVSTEKNTKRIYRRDYRGWRLAGELLRGLLGFDYAWQLREVLHRRQADRARDDAGSWSGLKPFIPVAMVQSMIAVVLIAWSPWIYLGLWVWPRVGAAMLFSKLRSSTEHLPLPSETGARPDGPYYLGTTAPVARTVHASWWERLFFSKINFHYHREHHQWPGISYQYLPLAFERLHASGAPGEESGGYLSTLIKFWKVA